MQPEGTKPNYDFMNDQPQQPKTGLQLPGFLKHASGMSMVTLVVVLVVLFMVVIFAGSGSSYKNELDLIARTQEINRVSALAVQQATTQDTKDLAATIQTSLLSQQQQLIAYLATKGTKVDPTKQTAYKNTSTDTQLSSAAQAGTLDQTYKAYLKSNLAAYQAALQQTYKTAKGTERSIITTGYNGNLIVLAGI